jgi:hypothetical protein
MWGRGRLRLYHRVSVGSFDGTGPEVPVTRVRRRMFIRAPVAGHGVIVKPDNLFHDAVRTAAS